MKTFLAAIDFSKTTADVIEQSALLAESFGAKLWILHVAADLPGDAIQQPVSLSGLGEELDSMPMGDGGLMREINAEELKREHAELQSISADLRGRNIDAQAILLQGNAPKKIIEKARSLEADMILIGSHGHGLLHKALLGSVSESVLRHAPCSVLIIPSGEK